MTAQSDAGRIGLDVRSQTADKNNEATRRAEILEIANSLIASSGVRTSIYQIADAAGILPGSLYFHFESKEALLVELFRRYHAIMDRIGADGLAAVDKADPLPAPELITKLGCAIARGAVENRGALQMSLYEAPSTDPELTELMHRPPSAIYAAMLQALRVAKWSGYLRPDLDLPTLADRFCQTILQVGLDVIRHNASSDQVATVLCRIMLEGLATEPPSDASLDESAAFAAANRVIQTWAEDDVTGKRDKAAHIRAVARAEFARRGYEITTIRDIAAAGAVGASTVYRLMGSKEELLASIMQTFDAKQSEAWGAVLRSQSTPLEKVDALGWINVNVLSRFPDEFRIQLAWMRNAPPAAPNPNQYFNSRLTKLTAMLNKGIRSGEIRVDSPTRAILARAVIGVVWPPQNIAQRLGEREALIHVRDTVLRGVAARSLTRGTPRV